jgi:hypothetical protein
MRRRSAAEDRAANKAKLPELLRRSIRAIPYWFQTADTKQLQPARQAAKR